MTVKTFKQDNNWRTNPPGVHDNCWVCKFCECVGEEHFSADGCVLSYVRLRAVCRRIPGKQFYVGGRNICDCYDHRITKHGDDT